MTRAVIHLTSDIRRWLPVMARVIEGCACNEAVAEAAFRYEGYSVTVTSDEITIGHAGTTAEAKQVMDWIEKAVLIPGCIKKEGQSNE